jgi:hypothetical protein
MDQKEREETVSLYSYSEREDSGTVRYNVSQVWTIFHLMQAPLPHQRDMNIWCLSHLSR